MRTLLQLRSSLTDEATRALLGKKATPGDFPVILHGEASAYKPNGRRLLTLLPKAIPGALIDAAWPFMWEMRRYGTNNRGAYAGEDRLTTNDKRPQIKTGVRYVNVKEDGTISNTDRAADVPSVVAGALDRSARIPYCRQTLYVTKHPELWGAALPFLQHVGQLFKETVSDRYAAQLEAAQRTHPAYVIPGTPFTTVTVNNTVAGAFHTDKGDYEPGFGCMVVFRKGTYSGAEIGFPKYGVGADMQHGDVIFFDPHEVHGNIPFRDGHGFQGKDWVRISMVLYFRQHMVDCLEPGAEIERAKTLRGSLE